MKTFKKIITLALVLSMLATLFIPMGVNAAATKRWTKTSELWMEGSNSELSAVKTATAPTIDGTKEAIWDNAQPLVINAKTRQTLNLVSLSNDMEVYMLYDNTNLYILADVDSGKLDFINILPEHDYSARTLAQAQQGTKTFDGYMPKFELGTEGNLTVKERRYVYADDNLTAGNATKEANWVAEDTGVKDGTRIGTAAGGDLVYGKYTGEAGNCIMEIVIPWKHLGCEGPTPFGMKIHNGSIYHLTPNGGTGNGSWYGGSFNQDCAWHDPVALKDAKGATPAYITAAAALTNKTAWTKTSDLFAHDSNTDLGAILTATAPSLDGTKDAIWDNAYPLTLNNFTAKTISNAYFGNNQDTKVYMLYDNTNLYLLAEVGANTVNKLTFNIVPDKNYTAPKNKTDAAADTVDWDGFMPDFQVADSGENTGATPKITERSFVYKDNTLAANNGDKSTRTGDVASTTAIQAKYNGSKENGWTMEIAIPWSYLDCTAPTDFGLKVTTSGFHINVAEYYLWQNGGKMNHDCAYLDPVELRATKGTAPAYLTEAEAIKAAFDVYAAAIVNPEITEFTIGTKAELLAIDIYDKLNNTGREPGETLYSGKTFKLTANIDLNPGVDWATYTPDNAHWGIYTGTVPATTWSSIRDFAGIFDGQGFAISGLYNNGYAQFVYGGGFIGEVYNDRGLDHGIKNLTLASGYMISANSDCNGAVVGSVRTCGAFLKNIYVGELFTWNAKAVQTNWAGGLVGRAHDHTLREGELADFNTITIANCVYAGKIIYSANATSINDFHNSLIGQTNMKKVADDPVTEGTDETFETKCIVTDCVFVGEIWLDKLLATNEIRAVGDATNGSAPAYITRVYGSAASAAADTANAVYLATMANGDVLPVAVAEMISGIYAQNNTANKDVVRIVTEINSLDWTKFGYKITAVRADGKVATFDDTANTKVYDAVTAGGAQVTANAAPFDVMNGAALYAVELKGIDTTTTYTVTIVPVWTINDVVIEGCAHTFTLPVAN